MNTIEPLTFVRSADMAVGGAVVVKGYFAYDMDAGKEMQMNIRIMFFEKY